MKVIRKNLVLRSATIEDAEILVNWWNDGKVMAHAGFPHGLGTSIEKVKNESKAWNGEKGERLIIEVDSTPIGEMSYRNIENNTAEIGIKICNSAYQNQGLGPKFLEMLIHYLFHDLKKDRIILDTNLNNKRAQHVYEDKLGFTKVGIRYDCWTNQVGEVVSAVDYELMNPNKKE